MWVVYIGRFWQGAETPTGDRRFRSRMEFLQGITAHDIVLRGTLEEAIKYENRGVAMQDARKLLKMYQQGKFKPGAPDAPRAMSVEDAEVEIMQEKILYG